MNKEKYFIDLNKLSEEQWNEIEKVTGFSLIANDYPYFIWLNGSWDQGVKYHIKDRTELTYPEFIKLFEGGDEENGGWIKIESEADLPPYNKWVIAHTKDGGNHIAYFDKRRSEWVANSKFGDEITHWRHQPEPPKF